MSYYDQLAPAYAELHGAEQLKKYRAIHGALRLAPDARILDVGCGTGIAAQVFPHVTGVDPAGKLLVQAPIPKALATAERLPFKDKAFDAILCVSALHNFTDPARALDEMRRLATGPVAVSILRKAAQNPALRKLVEERFTVEREIADPIDDILICR